MRCKVVKFSEIAQNPGLRLDTAPYLGVRVTEHDVQQAKAGVKRAATRLKQAIADKKKWEEGEIDIPRQS